MINNNYNPSTIRNINTMIISTGVVYYYYYYYYDYYIISITTIIMDAHQDIIVRL